MREVLRSGDRLGFHRFRRYPSFVTHGLRLGEQPVQRASLDPLLAADPPREALLALALEPNHEEMVRAVDRRGDDLEACDLRDVPHQVPEVTVFDRLLHAR